MYAPVNLVVLALLGAGVSVSGSPAQPIPHMLLMSSKDTAVNNRTLSSFVATVPGTTSSINWTQSIAGVDGIGGGNNVFRVAVLVDGSDVCHIDVDCDAAAPADYVAACTPTDFETGQDIDIRITSMPCLGAPSGFQTTDLVQR